MNETSGVINRLKRTFPREMAKAKEGPASCTPLVGDVDGEPWTMISDGHAMLVIPGTHGELGQERFNVTAPLAIDSTWTGRRTNRHALSIWCGRARTHRDEAKSVGMLYGIRIDRSLMAACIRGATDTLVTVYTRGPRDRIVVHGDGWRAAVMPVEPEPSFDEVAHA